MGFFCEEEEDDDAADAAEAAWAAAWASPAEPESSATMRLAHEATRRAANARTRMVPAALNDAAAFRSKPSLKLSILIAC